MQDMKQTDLTNVSNQRMSNIKYIQAKIRRQILRTRYFILKSERN